MFNYVLCEVPLPDGYEGEFETKDLEPLHMDRYMIAKSGRLIVTRKIFDENERPKDESPDQDENKNLAMPLLPRWRVIEETEDTNFHGIFTFSGNEIIGHEPDENNKNILKPIHKYHYYKVKFTDGQLVEIKIMGDDDYRLPVGSLFP